MNDNNPCGDLVALLTTVVEQLPEERVRTLLALTGQELLTLLQGEETTSTDQPATSVPIEHESICIQFELDGQHFEAVGFLRANEESVLGEEAIRRCDTDDLVVRSDEDWKFVYKNQHQLPAELRSYWLVTARPSPVDPRGVSDLGFGSDGWCRRWRGLGGRWNRGDLVLRRRNVS